MATNLWRDVARSAERRRTTPGLPAQAAAQDATATSVEFHARLGIGRAVAVDGRTLLGSGPDATRPQHLWWAAVTHDTSSMLAQTVLGEKTNEIPTLREWVAPPDLRARVVTADALHTQTEAARYLVEEQGAEYVLTVKDNQKTMHMSLTRPR